MKISFLMPPSLDGKECADRCYGCNYSIYFLPHLPTLYMATILKNNGFDVEIHDFAAWKKTKKDFTEFISYDDSDVYVFFSVFLSEKTDIKAKKLIQKIRDDVKFVYCGTQATWNPTVFLDENSYVIRGEPEYTILELISILKEDKTVENIKGLSYVKNKQIFHNLPREPIKNIDDIPIPDRSLLDHTPYYNPKLSKTPHTAILTSRGCFGKCWYCVPNSLSFARELEYKRYNNHKKPVPRLHSVKRVIDEFTEIASLGFKSVSVIDDEFLWNESRTIEICDGIKDLDLEWSCLARADMITEKSAKAMKNAGCSYVDIGVESFDQKVLDAIGKEIKVYDVFKGVKILKKYGIEPEINVLMGATPIETEESIRMTINKVEELGVDYVLYSIASPFPGTEFYYASKENGWMITKEYVPIDPNKEALVSYPHLSKEKLEYLLNKAYRIHYFNIPYIFNQIKKIKSMDDFKNKSKTAINLFSRNILKKF